MLIDPNAITPAQLRSAAIELLKLRGLDATSAHSSQAERLNREAMVRAAEIEVLRYLQTQVAVHRAFKPTT